MSTRPAPSHADLRDAVRAFAEAVLRPQAASVDQGHRFPEEALKEAARLDLMGILVPPEYGGAGLDHVAFAVCIEELARACASTAVIIDVHNSVATEPVLIFGTEEQKRAWLPRLARGEVIGAFALTEPGSGSDAAALTTTATRRGGSYVLEGTKSFITNAGHAGLYIVFARTGQEPRAAGVSAFLVPGEAAGLKVGQIYRKMGLNGSATGEVVLDGVTVPAEAMLAPEGCGFQVAMRALDSGRIGISAQALGIAAAALEEALRFTSEREQFGRPVATFQGVGFTLADMATKLEAARLMTHHAASLCSAGRPFTMEASMAKLFTTDAAMEIAIDAVQLAGDYGYVSDNPFERHLRDVKATQIYEGSNQIQRVVIARHLLAGAR
ncbi:MAG: acyl-CoA dehydrogenase family protein [Candidatus Dormibacterales bacterium]